MTGLECNASALICLLTRSYVLGLITTDRSEMRSAIALLKQVDSSIEKKHTELEALQKKKLRLEAHAEKK